MNKPSFRCCLCAAAVLLPLAAAATEGSMGRPITGQQVYSNAGIIPPGQGLVLTLQTVYFSGDISGSRAVSLGRTVGVGLDVAASYTIGNLTYLWGTPAGRWNFASAIGLPVQYTRAELGIATPLGGATLRDSNTHFADLLINPFIAGFHISKEEHFALSMPIFAPTGSYDPDRLANAGQHTWTVSPTFSYTRLLEGGGELSTVVAVDFYSRNNDTDYKNGAVFRIDGMWTMRVAPQWNLGVVGGWIQQLADDTGPTADRLNGFKGHAVGLGPIVSWSGKLGQQPAAFSARWVIDVEAKNRPKGNGIALSLTLPFL